MNKEPDAQLRFEEELADFLREWNDQEVDELTVHTSGSTGIPKPLLVKKKRMENSARMTCRFLGLKAGDSALLCLPLRYIAGKMMTVRSVVGSLDLWPVAPDNHPLKNLNTAPVFAAMIPMQVRSSLEVPKEAELLREIRYLIIGGGAIDVDLAAALRNFPHEVWSTYGMTETLSHIAMRRLNGPEATEWYTPLEDVRIRLSSESTLVIEAPKVCDGELVTNDVAELNDQGAFRICGRKDNVINSGGIKIQIEEMEKILRPYISRSFFISSIPDPKFGEIAVMLLEAEQLSEEERRELNCTLDKTCRERLEKYHYPKDYFYLPALPYTETGKPDRATARKMAEQYSLKTN